jgi:hypothetical protein
MIKKYANPHIVYFNSIIILENIIIPSTSVFCHVTNVPASRTLLVLHERTTVAIGTSQSAWPVLEAATTLARTGRCTVRRWKADRFSTIGIFTPAGTIAIVAPVFSIPKPGARAFEAVDRGDTLDTGGNSTICK